MTTKTENQAIETRERRVVKPHARLIVDEDAYTILAEIPGADESSTEVKVEEDVLTFHARSVVEPLPEGFERVHSELDLCDWESSFRLNDRIDREGIEASVKHGVLRLRLPKLKPTLRTITVSSE